MKLHHFAALTFLSLGFQLGQANALGWKECYSQAQCGTTEFCGAVPDKPVGSCQPSDSWPLTPATATDATTGVYGSSVVLVGGGAERVYPPNYTPPEPDFSGACVTISNVASGTTERDQVLARAVCNKRGDYRIALPPGDYLLKSSRSNKSETVRAKIGVFQLIDLSVYLEPA
jgi:hypothetical protein